MMKSVRFYKSFDKALPKPIALNVWKHHLGFIREAIPFCNIDSIDSLLEQLICIKGAVLDIYIGSLTPSEIAGQIVDCLFRENCLDIESYNSWIIQGGNFRNITLQDGSVWTLTFGRFTNRYVHIHPARYSLNSKRVRSTTLKVAILFSVLFMNKKTKFSLQNINFIRQDYFHLSPVKGITVDGSLGTLIGCILDEKFE